MSALNEKLLEKAKNAINKFAANRDTTFTKTLENLKELEYELSCAKEKVQKDFEMVRRLSTKPVE